VCVILRKNFYMLCVLYLLYLIPLAFLNGGMLPYVLYCDVADDYRDDDDDESVSNTRS